MGVIFSIIIRQEVSERSALGPTMAQTSLVWSSDILVTEFSFSKYPIFSFLQSMVLKWHRVLAIKECWGSKLEFGGPKFSSHSVLQIWANSLNGE